MDAFLNEFNWNAFIFTVVIGFVGFFLYLIYRKFEEFIRHTEESKKQTDRNFEEFIRQTEESKKQTDRNIEELIRETNRKIEEKIQGVALTIHSIEKQLPENIVHILLTPSQASKTKNANFQSIMDILFIDPPKLSNIAHKPSRKNFSNFTFTWNWGNQPESSVNKPFIEAVSGALLKLDLEVQDVSGGQLLFNQLLFTTKIHSLRVLDENGQKKGPVYYKGEIRGRTDLVVVESKREWVYIRRHNVRFAIEIKLPLKSESEIASAIREAITQLLGLCCDNPLNSPPVLLTDFVNLFIVLSLRRPSKNPLKFVIDAIKYPDIASALSSAHQISTLEGISEDLGRCNTPDGSAENEADTAESHDGSFDDDLG